MARLASIGIRIAALLLVLTLSLQFLQPKGAEAAASIALMPTSGPAGSTVQITGSGFSGNETVNIFFGGNFVKSTTASAGTINTTFTVPNVGPGTYQVIAAGSAASGTANFVVSSNTTTLTATKAVSVNGMGFTTFATAQPNDQLNYLIQVTNNSPVATATVVTITDTLQIPGQVPVTASPTCTEPVGSPVVTCTVGNIQPGGTATVFILTRVTSGFSGSIFDTAQASATNTPTATSNTTRVDVGCFSSACNPCFNPCNPCFNPCNPCISPCTPCVSPCHTCISPCNPCFNPCVQCFTTCNFCGTGCPFTFPVICGTVTQFTPATPTSQGSLTINGVTFVIAAGTSFFPTTVVVGGTFCFLLARNVITGCLSIIPTSVIGPTSGDYVGKVVRFRHAWDG